MHTVRNEGNDNNLMTHPQDAGNRIHPIHGKWFRNCRYYAQLSQITQLTIYFAPLSTI